MDANDQGTDPVGEQEGDSLETALSALEGLTEAVEQWGSEDEEEGAEQGEQPPAEVSPSIENEEGEAAASESGKKEDSTQLASLMAQVKEAVERVSANTTFILQAANRHC